jgi:hypothetical protein
MKLSTIRSTCVRTRRQRLRRLTLLKTRSKPYCFLQNFPPIKAGTQCQCFERWDCLNRRIRSSLFFTKRLLISTKQRSYRVKAQEQRLIYFTADFLNHCYCMQWNISPTRRHRKQSFILTHFLGNCSLN